MSVYAIQVSKLGATELVVSILGPWDKAPKAGRVAYEQYTAAIAALVGGEASTEVRVLRLPVCSCQTIEACHRSACCFVLGQHSVGLPHRRCVRLQKRHGMCCEWSCRN